MQLHDVAAAQAAAGGNSSSLSGAWQALLSAAWSSLGQDNPGGGVQDLAEALKVALAKGLSSGQDLAPALAKALDDGLDKAVQTLTSLGVSASRAAHLAASFRRQLSSALDALDPPGISLLQGSSGASTGSHTSTGASSNSSNPSGAVFESGTLKLVTAQGDRVAIRFSEWGAFATGTADGAATTTSSAGPGSDSGNGLSNDLLAGGRIQISVQGNLNSDELKAINDLLSQVNSLANQFFSGDLQDAFAAAAALNADPGEIARYSLHLTYAQLGVGPLPSTAAAAAPAGSSGSTSTSANGAGTPAASSDTTNSASSDTSSASSTSSTTPATSSDSSSASGATTGAPDASSADASSDTSGASSPSGMAGPSSGSVSSSAASSASPQQTIGSFIQDVLGKLAATTGGGSLDFSMKWKLELLATALPSFAPSTQAASAPSTQLASATLKSLAN